LDVTISLTVLGPPAVYTCNGFCNVLAGLPSPKLQFQLAIEPTGVVASVNTTAAPGHAITLVNVALGEGINRTLIVSEEDLQPPLLVELKISLTFPAILSKVLSVYIPLSEVAPGENVPVPLVVHIPAFVLVFTANGKGVFAQALSFEVMVIIGLGVNVIVTESRVAMQLPLPVVRM